MLGFAIVGLVYVKASNALEDLQRLPLTNVEASNALEDLQRLPLTNLPEFITTLDV
jgi:hypothetical protein